VVIHEVGNLYCLLPAQLAMEVRALAAPAGSVGAGPGYVIELGLQSSCRMCVEMPQLALAAGQRWGQRRMTAAGRQAQADQRGRSVRRSAALSQRVHPPLQPLPQRSQTAPPA
jgi:hypothetical protein